MSEKSIWFKRILMLATIEIDKTGVSIDYLVKKIKKLRIRSNIPSIFSKFNREGERIWLSNKRLQKFISLAVDLKIFLEENNLYFKSKEADLLKNKSNRKDCLERLCISAFSKPYDTSIDDIIEATQKISSPSTARKIARFLKLELTKEEFNNFESILQIYGDVSEKFEWTGIISFGTPYKMHLHDTISKVDIDMLFQLAKKSSSLKELYIKVNNIKKLDITKKQEYLEWAKSIFQELKEKKKKENKDKAVGEDLSSKSVKDDIIERIREGYRRQGYLK
ncbi:hypothetical protein ES705_17798 [subsurface metagenome]